MEPTMKCSAENDHISMKACVTKIKKAARCEFFADSERRVLHNPHLQARPPLLLNENRKAFQIKSTL